MWPTAAVVFAWIATILLLFIGAAYFHSGPVAGIAVVILLGGFGLAMVMDL